MIPAVADVVEAMSSHRLCHPALGVEVALEEISAGNGKRYGVVIVTPAVYSSRRSDISPGSSDGRAQLEKAYHRALPQLGYAPTHLFNSAIYVSGSPMFSAASRILLM